jgi:hypothetical protein
MKQDGTVYNTMYVHYDDDGTVHYISNVIDSSKRTFEIDISLIEEFLDYRKHAYNYKINYFLNLANGIVEEQVISNNNSNFIYLVPRTAEFNNELTLVHDKINRQWILTVREDVRYKLEVMPKFVFFLCKKDDPHYLYSYFTVDATSLMKQDMAIDFSNEFEVDLNLFSVAVERKLQSYGIREQND